MTLGHIRLQFLLSNHFQQMVFTDRHQVHNSTAAHVVQKALQLLGICNRSVSPLNTPQLLAFLSLPYAFHSFSELSAPGARLVDNCLTGPLFIVTR